MWQDCFEAAIRTPPTKLDSWTLIVESWAPLKESNDVEFTGKTNSTHAAYHARVMAKHAAVCRPRLYSTTFSWSQLRCSRVPSSIFGHVVQTPRVKITDVHFFFWILPTQ